MSEDTNTETPTRPTPVDHLQRVTDQLRDTVEHLNVTILDVAEGVCEDHNMAETNMETLRQLFHVRNEIMDAARSTDPQWFELYTGLNPGVVDA